MNLKSFEMRECSIFSHEFEQKGLGNDKLNKWCDLILENRNKFDKVSDFEGIVAVLDTLQCEGIDTDIRNLTSTIIANENDIMPEEKGVAHCFMMLTQKRDIKKTS